MDLSFGKPVPDGMMIVGGGWRDNHAGLDIILPQGTPIFAVADGVVSSASASSLGDLGIFAAITHPTGVVTRYLHFSQLLVTNGQQVSRGDLIGKSGNTGNSAGPHLHFDIKVPSPIILAEIIKEVGEPTNGFEKNVTGFGFGIPAEPWVPVDSYVPTVIANALANGIPLYRPRGVGSGGALLWTVGILATIGGAWWATQKA